MLFTLVTFVGFTALVALISYVKTKGSDETSADGYFLGGRSLSGLVIMGSLMMTNLSAEQLVGRNGQGYSAGMTAMGWEAMCPIALTLLALFFIPRYLKRGITTIPEFLEERFDRTTRVLISAIYMGAYILCSLPLVLYSGSVVFENIFNISALLNGNRFIAIAICCVALGVIGGIYAIFGGLKAVAVSDSLNGILFIAGAGLLVPILAFIALGSGSLADGARTFLTAAPDHLNTIWPYDAQAPYIPRPMIIIGCGINHVSYWCTNQSIIQRTLGAKNTVYAGRFAGNQQKTTQRCRKRQDCQDLWLHSVYCIHPHCSVCHVHSGGHRHVPEYHVGILRCSGSGNCRDGHAQLPRTKLCAEGDARSARHRIWHHAEYDSAAFPVF